MKKRIIQIVALFAALLICTGTVHAQTGSTLLDTNFEDWKPTIGTDQANGTYTVPGATVKIQGRPTFNNSSTPNAGTSTLYPNYFRFGSDGSESNQYLEITPAAEFVNGGRITLIVSTNSNAAAANIFFAAYAGSWNTYLAEFNQIGKTFETKTFDLPTTDSGTKTIRLYRLGTTVFLHAIKIETNISNELPAPAITSFVVGGVIAVINEAAGTITAELPSGTDLTSLTPTIGMKNTGDHYTPTGAQNFTDPVTYTVYNSDNSKSKAYTVTLSAAVTLSNDATLKDLKYNGTTVSAFSTTKYSYTIELPYGSAAPEVGDVTAEKNHTNATVGTITRSSATLPTDITVPVTAENETTTASYVIHFTQKDPSTDAKLKTLKLNGSLLQVVADRTDYVINWPYFPATAPVVTATANDADATVAVTQASNISGQAIIAVTAQDGHTVNYTITFATPSKPTKTWIVGDDDVNFPAGTTYTDVTTVEGLTISGATSGMDINAASAVNYDGFSYPQRFRLGGAGYSGASDANETPKDNMPTQRYLSLEVAGNSTIVLRGVTGSNSSARKIFLTDGQNLIGRYDFPSVDKTTISELSVYYKGPAATLYLFGNAACNLYQISVVEEAADPIIASFKIGETEAVIDQESFTITAELPEGSDLTNITPVITLGESAVSYTPLGAQDFTNPVIYTAFNADESNYTSYIVTLTIASKDDATLKTLTVNGESVTVIADKEEYVIDLPYGTTTVPTVIATANDPNATVVITPAENLQGKTTIVITAEDGVTTKTYTVSFNVLPAPLSDDATLKTLTVNGESVEVVTDKAEYVVDVAYGTTTVPTVVATANDPNATVAITPAANLQEQTTIVITAEDGVTSKTYTVSFNILPAPLSDDATLKTLTVNGEPVTVITDKAEYVIDLPYGTTIVPTVVATANDPNATVAITPAANLQGKTTIVITAEDGVTKKTYTVAFNVLPAPLSDDATLKTLTVGEEPVTVVADKAEYIIDVPYGTTAVPAVTATANDAKATVVITPAANLQGKTTIVITAEDGVTKKTYTVAFNVLEEVGIANVNPDKEVKSVRYYDVSGRQVNASAKGMVIVKTIYTDGTSSSGKVYRLDK